jgi:PAS domain S-box-containing protein
VVTEHAANAGWPAVVVTDASGVVVHWSRSAARTYGWSDAEAVGRRLGELYLDDAAAAAAAGELAALAPGEAREAVTCVRRRDGATFTVHHRETPVFDGDRRLVAAVSLSYAVDERAAPATRAAGGRATDRLRKLQEVTAELSRATTTDEAAQVVLSKGLEIEGAGSGALWLVDEAAGVLRFVASTGAAPGATDRFRAIPLDSDLPGAEVVRTREPAYVRSLAERDIRWPMIAGVPSAMEAQAVVPLVVDDRALGCLSFGFRDVRDFAESDRDFLAALTNVCAQVFDRARLYDAERAANARVAFLAEASRVLNSSLDYPETLERCVALLLDAFAALVAIDVVTPEGTLERVAMGHADPAKRAATERLRDNPVRPGTNTWEVLRTGTPRLIDELSEDELRRAAGDDERYEAVREIAYGPAMVVPMTARGGTVGVLFVARGRGEAPFTADDLTLAVDLGARAGSAVDNARLYASRADVARLLQQGLLPPRLPDVPGLELAARYRPAYAGLDVGGDFYDCYAVGDRWAFMIGDVVGTGPAAAALTALVRHTARAVAPYVDGPAEVLHAVREALVAGGDDEVFCTLLYGTAERVADGVRLAVIGAGHPPPFVVRADGGVERVPTTGGLLGAPPPVGIDAVEVLLRPGDAFVGVTDGVLEARPAVAWDAPDEPAAFFDEGGLLAVLEGQAGVSADAVAGAIESAVLEFTRGRAPDDVAVLVLRAT